MERKTISFINQTWVHFFVCCALSMYWRNPNEPDQSFHPEAAQYWSKGHLYSHRVTAAIWRQGFIHKNAANFLAIMSIRQRVHMGSVHTNEGFPMKNTGPLQECVESHISVQSLKHHPALA